MGDDRAIQRYRRWYGRLLRLYRAPYYERFGEQMEQTFNDVLREHGESGRSLFACALWVFIETSAGIVRENMTHMIENWSEKKVYRVALAVGLAVPLIIMIVVSRSPSRSLYGYLFG